MSHPIFEHFPVIDCGQYVLRQITKSDVAPFYKYISDPMVNKYLAAEDIPHSLSHAEKELFYWADLYTHRHSIYWAIAKKNDNVLIGTCGFNIWNRNHHRAEISYDLARTHWNKGIMTLVLRNVCDFAMGAMQVNRIQATVALDNIGSQRVLEKLNFKREGILREYGTLHGVRRDFYMYSLLFKDMTF